ncbi:MAG: site-2 protease family protein [Opitutales bacterium]|nr:site-2 protease family protein [Opitutales bacterium]
METSWIAKHLLAFFLLLVSLVLHEWGHAWVAYHCGDSTPKLAGRVTLNPLPHVDFLGTILFPLICIFTGGGILFGWGKPVPMNPTAFSKPWKWTLANSAGLLGNFLLCLVASFVLTASSQYALLAYTLLQLNAVLIAFNLLPLPGLDGFPIFQHLCRFSEETVLFLERWGFFILLLLINLPIVRTVLFHLVEGIIATFLRISIALYGMLG